VAKINEQRLAANIEGDFVVFIIGMRVNRPWRVRSWFPVFMAMPRMIAELEKDPESGFLGYEQRLSPRSPVLVQYWRSYEHLHRYARSKDGEHFPAWVAFNKRVGSNGDVGIWHETFRVRAGEYECVYNNMPAYGLGKAAELVPASGRRATASGRLGVTDGSDAPVTEAGEPVAAPGA
jgi:hypothetical protein